MGGEAAKERRRLKRLAEQQNGTGEDAAPAPGQLEPDNGRSTAQLRLQRKLARKATGKFKPQQGQSPQTTTRKRKTESNSGNPAKKFNAGSNHVSSKKSNVRNTAAVTKMKPKKPKHLKRKMEQLTKAMSIRGSGSGTMSTVVQLEQQMQTLVEQMELYKTLKSGKMINFIKPDAVDTAQNGGCISEADKVHFHKENEAKRESSSLSQDDDSSSSENDNLKKANTRSRGKRRRGRRDSNNDKLGDVSEKGNVPKISSDVEIKTIIAEARSTAPHAIDDEDKLSKKTSRMDDKRRCIGRKPVTDFEIGKCYSGKVRYIKPRLGAFIDIGCHSDAFVHISCISDSYISSVDEVLNVGDEVASARVVEIDREKRRVTLSLRSKDHDAVYSQKGKTSDAILEPEKQERREISPVAVPVTQASPALSGQKTGADLKRERKLARRVARRALRDNA